MLAQQRRFEPRIAVWTHAKRYDMFHTANLFHTQRNALSTLNVNGQHGHVLPHSVDRPADKIINVGRRAWRCPRQRMRCWCITWRWKWRKDLPGRADFPPGAAVLTSLQWLFLLNFWFNLYSFLSNCCRFVFNCSNFLLILVNPFPRESAAILFEVAPMEFPKQRVDSARAMALHTHSRCPHAFHSKSALSRMIFNFD